jgi:phage terminase large subunit-like protein
MNKDWTAIALDYARAVVAGRVPASKWVKLACQRHLDDLAKVEDRAYPWRYSRKRAHRVCKFASMLPVGGRQAAPGKTVQLQPWQIFILACVFGWVEKATKLRRFRTALCYVPRKNGKSFLSAVVGLYMLLLDEEQQAEVYCGASTAAQALKVWGPAATIVRRTPGLKQLGVKVGREAITVPATESKMVTLIGQPLDGDNPSCFLGDETHQWANDNILTAMESGMGERTQPLVWITTTAGVNLASPAKLMQDDLQDVLLGNKQNDRLFGMLYGLDEGEDWTTDASIYKANPNIGVSVRYEFLREQVDKAESSPRLQANVKTKHFNVWCNSAIAWLDMDKWARCADPKLRIEDFLGERCIAAFDLANVKDLTAYVLIFRRELNGKEHYYLFPRFYLPSARIDDPTAGHYRQWRSSGHLESVHGEVNTHEDLLAQILEDAKRFEIEAIAHDPYRAYELVAKLIAHGLTCVAIDQGWRGLSEPMKLTDALVTDNRIHYPSPSPVLSWCVSNTVAKPVRGDNIVPERASADRKIDGVDATLMGLSRWMVTPSEDTGPEFGFLSF